MGLTVLSNKVLKKYISICKSDSKICGIELRDAHYRSGIIMGQEISDIFHVRSYAVIIMMRGGLPFGLGVADALEKESNVNVNITFCDKDNGINIDFGKYEKIVIVDSVIKTGKSMLDLANKINDQNKIIFATNVIDKTCSEIFRNKITFAIRMSENSYTGSEQKNIVTGKGPDTGDRLFNSDFFD